MDYVVEIYDVFSGGGGGEINRRSENLEQGCSQELLREGSQFWQFHVKEIVLYLPTK